jgi:hypothetical protein
VILPLLLGAILQSTPLAKSLPLREHSQVSATSEVSESPEKIGTTTDAVTARAMVTFAQCVVMRDPKEALNFLNSGKYAQPGNEDVRSLISKNQNCLRSGRIKFNQVIFAGSAAEVFYRFFGFFFSDHKTDLANSPNPDGAACVAVAKPNELDALISTFPASEEETAALKALEQTVEECMPNVSHRPAILRAAIMAGVFPTVSKLMKAYQHAEG